jgi:hypothetical protein
MSDDHVLTLGDFHQKSLVHRAVAGHAITRAGGVFRMVKLSTKALIDLPKVSVHS